MKIFKRILILVVLLPVVIVVLWTVLSLNVSYSHGERAGIVQKFSKRGWICKTWEGELAMVNTPGALTEVFKFTVRDEEVAKKINASIGQASVVVYDQHRFVPTSCFGETEYFVSDVRARP